jgi:hypothetical protein
MATRSSRICRFDKQASDHLSDAFALTQTVVLQSQPLTTNPFVPNAAPVSKLYTVQGKDILQVSEAVTAAIKMVSLHSQYNPLVATPSLVVTQRFLQGMMLFTGISFLRSMLYGSTGPRWNAHGRERPGICYLCCPTC